MEQSVPKRRHIKFRSRGLPRRKHTTFRTRRMFEIKNRLSSSRLYFASIGVFIDTSVQYILQSTATSLPKGMFDFKVNVFSGTDVASIGVFIDTSVQYILQSTATSLPKGMFDFKVNVFSGTDVYTTVHYCHFVHHESDMCWHRIKSGPPCCKVNSLNTVRYGLTTVQRDKMNTSQIARTCTYLPFPSFRAISSCKKSSRFSSFSSRNSIVSLTTFRKNVDTFRGVRGSFRAIAADGTSVYSNPIILSISDSSTIRLPHCRNSASGYFRQLH